LCVHVFSTLLAVDRNLFFEDSRKDLEQLKAELKEKGEKGNKKYLQRVLDLDEPF